MLSITASPDTRTANGIILAFFSSLLAVLFLPASEVYAVQAHGGTEGLVSHQLGHTLFTLAMVVLLLRMKKTRLTGPGWNEFKKFLWLIISWNVLTFSGHWMREKMTVEHFILQNNHVSTFQADTLFDLIFYLTRLDHLLLVPAFFMLLLAIRNWERTE